MRNKIIAGATALAFIAATASAQSAPVPDRAPGIIPPSTAAAEEPTKTKGDWIEGLASKTFTAVDDSTITLTLNEDGFARHLVSPGGDQQDTSFTFIGPNLGTVSDGTKVLGFFRRNGDGLEITFEDGRIETIGLTPDGGVSMKLSVPGGSSHCMSWYPQGHAFNDAEKRAALALYAKRLGIASSAPGNTAPIDSCAPSSTASQTAVDQPTPVKALLEPVTPQPAKRNKKRSAALDLPAKAPIVTASFVPRDSALPLVPVAVRTSQVREVPDDAPLTSASLDASHGASACLSVDSDGGHWGFRNHCRFDVRFAYCLKNAGTDIASCDKGPETGLVAANGFTPLLASNVLGGNDAERHFRWVGCGLVDGVFEAHLDQTNPPAGRCIAQSAS